MDINIQKTFYKVADFIAWQKSHSLILTPEFQRRPVWKIGAKSYLIDTIVRGFPIPIIFLRDQGVDTSSFEAKREVIDGQQRLRTLISYISPDLLPDFEPSKDSFTVMRIHNKELAGLSFAELDPKLQNKILDYQFDVHVLPSWVDDRDVLQLFRRMNSTNYPLKPQELRNAEYFGEFKTLAYQLAAQQLHRWRAWKTFTEDNIARMQEVELTSEFIILMLRMQLAGKNTKMLDNFYEKYDKRFPEAKEIEKRFNLVMDTINDKIGADMTELALGRQALMYSLFAFCYDKLFGLKSNPAKSKKAKNFTQPTIDWVRTVGKNIQSRNAPDDVLKAADRRTTNVLERKKIYDYFHKKSK